MTPSTFPPTPDAIRADVVNADLQRDLHPFLHNLMAAAVNALQAAWLSNIGVNWLDYGGSAAASGTVNSFAMAAALTAASASLTRLVWAPAGTYNFAFAIALPSDVEIRGAGWQATFFRIENNAGINLIDTTANVYRAKLNNLCLDCNKANNATKGMGIKGWYDHSLFEWIWIKNCGAEAMYLCPGDGYVDGGYPAGNAFDMRCANIEIEDSDIGVRYTSKLTDAWFGPRINMASDSYNLYCTSQGSPIFWRDCWFNGNPINNIYYPASGTGINFQGCTIENAQQHNILITEPSFLSSDHAAFLSIQGGYIKNGNTDAGAFDAVHVEGYDATHRLLHVNVHTTFINDTSTPRYGVYLKHVRYATINGCDMDTFGTDYFAVEGTSSFVTIEGNTPQNYKVKSVAFADSPYTATLVDGVILADATGGAIVVTLPAAASVQDRRITTIKTDAGGNTVTVNGTVLGAQGDHTTFWSTGTSWWLI